MGLRGRCYRSRWRRSRRRPGRLGLSANGPRWQDRHRSRDSGDGRNHGLGGRSHGYPAALSDHYLDGIALFRIQDAQLVLDIESGLAAKIQQIFTFDIQFLGQGIDSNFLSLQIAAPPRMTPTGHPAKTNKYSPQTGVPYFTGSSALEKGN